MQLWEHAEAAVPLGQQMAALQRLQADGWQLCGCLAVGLKVSPMAVQEAPGVLLLLKRAAHAPAKAAAPAANGQASSLVTP